MNKLLTRPFFIITFSVLLVNAALFGFIYYSPSDSSAESYKEKDLIEMQLDGHRIFVKVAQTPSEHQRGLMNVKSLDPDHGMLFMFTPPQRLSFWMKNTYIPLDIGYFAADGTLREIHALYPHNQDPVQSKATHLSYALELPQGWFEAHEVYPGAKLDLEPLQPFLKN